MEMPINDIQTYSKKLIENLEKVIVGSAKRSNWC